MPNEHASPGPEMNEFEAALGALSPSLSRVDRDRVMYRAGQGATRPGSSGRRAWLGAVVGLALVASAEGVLLARRPPTEVVERVVFVRESVPSPPLQAVAEVPRSTPLNRLSGPGFHDRLAGQVLRYGLDGLPASTLSSGSGREPWPAPSRRVLREQLRDVLDLGDPS